MTDSDARAAHEEWLRAKLAELDAIERKIESARPTHGLRERILVLYLLAAGIGAGVVVSTEPSLLSTSAFGLLLFSVLASLAVLTAPRHRLKALEWRRDELLAEIGEPPTRDGSTDGRP